MTKDRQTERVAFLKSSEEVQLKLGLKILTAHDGALYPHDLLASAVINRSVELIKGFCLMIEEKKIEPQYWS